MNNSIRSLLIFALGVFVITILAGYLLLLRGGQGDPVQVLIPRGSTGTSVAEKLHEHEVISNPLVFRLALKLSGGSHRLRAGEFEFHKNSSTAVALYTLYYSEPIVHKVTVPEGWTVKQIAELLAQKQLVDPMKFVTLAMSPNAAAKYQMRAPTLEGFLFPDTYKFSKIDGEERILDTMVRHLLAQITPEMKARAKQLGFTVEEWITFASIIERETGAPEERPLISSVFHNRLKKKMRLQSDPTTIYGIPNYNGNITKKDLLTPTPYNTYTIPALPPGAIASPGFAALQAALNPATSNYLFFVASTQGKHIFSETYEGHSKMVNEHQKKRGRQPMSAPWSKKKNSQKKRRR